MDPDTDDSQLVYEITAEPKHGFLENKQKPGGAVTTFTQGTEPKAGPRGRSRGRGLAPSFHRTGEPGFPGDSKC